MCLWLCTTSIHNTAQNSSDNLPLTPVTFRQSSQLRCQSQGHVMPISYLMMLCCFHAVHAHDRQKDRHCIAMCQPSSRRYWTFSLPGQFALWSKSWVNEIAMILSAVENQLRALSLTHCSNRTLANSLPETFDIVHIADLVLSIFCLFRVRVRSPIWPYHHDKVHSDVHAIASTGEKLRERRSRYGCGRYGLPPIN